MNIREISTSRLREYENNPRNNDLAVEKVKYSIERFGFLFPVVVDMTTPSYAATPVCGLAGRWGFRRSRVSSRTN